MADCDDDDCEYKNNISNNDNAEIKSQAIILPMQGMPWCRTQRPVSELHEKENVNCDERR